MNCSPCTHEYSIVVAGHGSRDRDGIQEFEQFVQLMRSRNPQMRIDYGYLEFATPTIDEAVRLHIDQGSTSIVMLPALLSAAMHAKNDMPSELNALKQDFPDIDFHFGAPMDLHPGLLQLSRQRIIEAECKSRLGIKRSETCLVVVGRGTTDPDANSDISKLARMLEEGMGFGSSFVCYSGTANPLVKDGLRVAAKLGFRRMIVFPYFLFDGTLVKRIYDAAGILSKRMPDMEVLSAGYLGLDPVLSDVFMERAQEGIAGRATMNCCLCKYRVQIVGFENQVGTPQQAHHLKVRASSTGVDKPSAAGQLNTYQPHPIEAKSFEIINRSHDWSPYSPIERSVLQRLVHTSGDFAIVDDIFISAGALETGVRALLRCKRVVTDVTMVETGLKRALLSDLSISTWCGVHDPETELLSRNSGLTRSAAGIQRAWQLFGNDLLLAIGDAPTAIVEALRLIKEHGWRPQMLIGLPVGFVGTVESKEDLRRCLHVPRLTNSGTRGGSPWAASVVNAMMIEALNQVVAQCPVK